MVLYEIKTFIKKQEVRINKKAILQDVLKLAIKKKKYTSIEAYMLIAGKIEVIKPALISDHLLLPNKFGDVYNRASMTLSLSRFKEVSVKEDLIDKAERLGIKTISISPSRWRQYDGMCVISWRINKL